MDSRKKHEKDYHNKRFKSNLRKKADSNYVISNSIKHEYECVLEKICTNKKVLEIGCSGGGRICHLASLGNHMTGIDISESAIEQAIETSDNQNLVDVEFKVMDAENLTFEDNSFDIVYGNGILHHLDLEHIYTELNRILRPGGTALFIEPMGHNAFINLYRKMTPSYRTKTEHPLQMADIRVTKNYFKDMRTKYYYLFTILSIPFKSMFFFRPLLWMLETIDRIFFTIFPFTRRFAWMVLLELKNPLKKQS